jgi:hypothetical protein
MAHRPSRLPALELSFWLMVGLAACAPAPSRRQCVNDLQCGPGRACMMTTCLPRGDGRAFALELSPRLDSTSAPTELPDVALGSDSLQLMAEDGVVIAGKMIDSEGGVYSSDGHVTVLTRSLIPGRGDLQLEADMADFHFNLVVRQNLVSALVTLSLAPTPKAVSQVPVSFVIALERMVNLTLPRTVDMSSLGGTLLGPLDDPLPGFVARARIAKTSDKTSDVISNAATTNASGRFRLSIAPNIIPAETTPGIVVELSPPGAGDAMLPHFVSRSMTLAGMTSSAPTFHMPAFGTPAPLVFTVRGGDGSMRPLSDVTVKFRTEIDAAPAGTAVYQRESSTDTNGQISVSLIPGTADRTRDYQVIAIPPPDSPYALKCLPKLSITGVGSNSQSQYSGTLLLERKAELTGTVTGSDGSAAPGLGVTATPISGTSDCADAQSPGPVSTTTSRSGGYRVRLDPGIYRIDVEPPVGAPYPELTLDGPLALTISGDRTQDIALPAGEVVEGDVVDSEQAGLPSASLRFFEVLCAGETCSGDNRIPPALRGQTRSDAAGHFRAVLPAP